jgi:hypothetical protein
MMSQEILMKCQREAIDSAMKARQQVDQAKMTAEFLGECLQSQVICTSYMIMIQSLKAHEQTN